jgi:hypothetical protein
MATAGLKHALSPFTGLPEGKSASSLRPHILSALRVLTCSTSEYGTKDSLSPEKYNADSFSDFRDNGISHLRRGCRAAKIGGSRQSFGEHRLGGT